MPLQGTVPDTSKRQKGDRELINLTAGMYYVKVLDADEAPNNTPESEAKYGGKSWLWKFVVADESGKPVMTVTAKNEQGQPYANILLQYTSDKLGLNPNTQQPAKARMFLEALTREPLKAGANVGQLYQQAVELGGIAKAFITPNARKPEFMDIASMMPVDSDTAARINAAFDKVPMPALYKAATVTEQEVPF